ncbi:MAG TPA: extracellular solute-binding protein [Mycobacteriales bacterium]|jgi:multiple sugar transport system substrate-binding protein|nr:extracellular solute-binding protein [Mycobacteriales bacterium]
MTGLNIPPAASRRTFLRGAGGLAVLGATGAAAAACGNNGGSGGSGELQQWYHQYGEKGTEQAAKKYAAAYKKKKVQVNWKVGDYGTLLSAALLGRNVPDVFESQFNIQLVHSKQVVPLDDIIGDAKSDFSDIDIQTNSLDGKLYGIRMIDDPQLLYYRKSLLQNAGLQPPSTIEELINATNELAKGKMKGLFAGNDAGAGAFGIVALHAAGGQQLTPDNKPGFTGDDAIEAYSSLRTLGKSKGLLMGAPTDWTDPGSFLNELCAMQWCGMWAMPQIEAKFKDDFGVIPFPKIGAAGKPIVYTGGWTAFVAAKSKNQDAAKAFLKWLWIDQEKFQEDWSLNYGFHIPPRKSLAAKATKLQSGAAAETVKLNSQYGMADNPTWTPNVGAPYGDMLTNIVRKGNDPKKETAKAAKLVQTQLKRLLG